MQIKNFLLLILIAAPLHAQNDSTGMIMGNGIEIRTEGFSKGTVIRKINGMLPVEIMEVSEHADGWGIKGRCDTYPWVKIKWEEDSTGWVFGKYLHISYQDEYFITPNATFTWNDKKYRLMVFLNYSYPPWDAEGASGCECLLPVFLYDMDAKKYYPIEDNLSKKAQSSLVIYYRYNILEKITSVKADASGIYISSYIDYRHSESSAAYVIQWIDGKFKVTSYTQEKERKK